MIDHFDLCCAGATIEKLVRDTTGADIRKALDPSDPDDYLKIVARLSTSMHRATRDTEAKILRKAINALDVDWPNISAAQRRRVIAAARSTLKTIPERILPAVTERLEVAGVQTMKGARAAVSRQVPIRIGSSLLARDERILKHLTGSQHLYITDQYARRRAGYSATARRIVEEGLRDGIGRDAIAASLQERLGVVAGLRRSEQYWSVISGAFTNHARTWGHLSGFNQAGIENFIFEAVLDEVTTDQCRFLHGKRFSVPSAMGRFQQAAEMEDPEQIKEVMPWIRSGRNADGERELFTQDREGNRTRIATVVRSGVGTADDLGSYKGAMSAKELDESGAFIPPLHGLCRSTVVADV